MDVNEEQKGQWAMLVAMLISGTMGFFVLTSGQHPQNVIFFRCLIGGITLTAYAKYKGYFNARLKLNKKEVLLLVVGAFTLVANWFFLFTAYSKTSIGLTTVIYHFQPFFLLIGSVLIYKERFTKDSWSWLLVAFFGVLIIAKSDLSFTVNGTSEDYILGCLSALMAAFLYACSTLCTRVLSKTLGTELIAISHMIIGFFVFLLLLNSKQLPQTDMGWLSLLVLGIFHTGIMRPLHNP